MIKKENDESYNVSRNFNMFFMSSKWVAVEVEAKGGVIGGVTGFAAVALINIFL